MRGPVQTVMERLAEACDSAHHQFWPDDISLLDKKIAEPARIHGPRQLTDVYLLALAVEHGGQFVTFDAAISVDSVRSGGKRHLLTL